MLRNRSRQKKAINPVPTLVGIGIQLALFGGIALSAVHHSMMIFAAAAAVAITVVAWGAFASPDR